jgi:S1/P1 nuclease
VTSQADGTGINAEITPAELSAWQNFDIATWAEESFALALSHAYRQPNGDAVVDGSVLGDDYFNAARPVVLERLKRAGVRLAHLINAAAAGILRANMLQLAEPQ